MAITTEAIDGLPQNRVYSETDTLDAIFTAIDNGGLGLMPLISSEPQTIGDMAARVACTRKQICCSD